MKKQHKQHHHTTKNGTNDQGHKVYHNHQLTCAFCCIPTNTNEISVRFCLLHLFVLFLHYILLYTLHVCHVATSLADLMIANVAGNQSWVYKNVKIQVMCLPCAIQRLHVSWWQYQSILLSFIATKALQTRMCQRKYLFFSTIKPNILVYNWS